jgi:selenocysteine-specific elongation factor
MGIAVTATPVAGRWLADPDHWARLRNRLVEVVAEYAQAHPLELGAPTEVLRQALCLPDRALVEALVAPPLVASAGRIGVAAAPDALPPAVERAIARIRADLDFAPFQAPDADRLSALGLGSAEIGAAVRAGTLFRIADGVVLLPGAVEDAARRLGALPQPFTLSEARQMLCTTRRVAIPLLELMDRRGDTRRLPDGRRQLTRQP